MADFSRCYPVPSLPPSAATALASASTLFDSAIKQLSDACWTHYNDGQDRRRTSLYVGSLGGAYVGYRLATSLAWEGDGEGKHELLLEASRTVERVLNSQPAGRRMRVTLLEGGRVGALALAAAINHSLRTDGEVGGESLAEKVSNIKDEILDIGTKYVRGLPASECEVLYGRAGYLHAMAFVRSETNDEEFGKELAQHIVREILEEGLRVSQKYRSNLPLLWVWHEKAYLGAIHGVVGIIFTLLCFYDEVSAVGEVMHLNAQESIKSTISKLDEHCFPSGNLQSSLGSDIDKLVHLCHGAPGHILLLVKAHEVLGDEKYLLRAEEVARDVICSRGLLKKGVGLCHGISGNAYCFLSLYRARVLASKRIAAEKSKANSHLIKSNTWLRWAHHFANFAVHNINDLFWIPDHPHSLYEGACGLIVLLNDLKDPDRSRFPCFEPGPTVGR